MLGDAIGLNSILNVQKGRIFCLNWFNNLQKCTLMLKRVILVFLLFPDSVPDHVEGGGGSLGSLRQPGIQLHHQQYLWRERGECWLVLLYTELCCSHYVLLNNCSYLWQYCCYILYPKAIQIMRIWDKHSNWHVYCTLLAVTYCTHR